MPKRQPLCEDLQLKFALVSKKFFFSWIFSNVKQPKGKQMLCPLKMN